MYFALTGTNAAQTAPRPRVLLASIKGPTDDRVSPEVFLKMPENRGIDRKSVEAALAAAGQFRCFDGPPSKRILRYRRKKGSLLENLAVLMTNPTPMAGGDNGFLFYSNRIALTAAHTFEGFDFHHCVFVAISAHIGERLFYGIREVTMGTSDPEHHSLKDFALAVLDTSVPGIAPLIDSDRPVRYGDRIVNISVATSNRSDPNTNNDPTMVSCHVMRIWGGSETTNITYTGDLCDDGNGSSGSADYAIEDGKFVLEGFLIRSGFDDYEAPDIDNQSQYLEIGSVIRRAADELAVKYGK